MARTLAFLKAQPVTKLQRLKPRKAEALAAMGIESIFDLLTHYPRRYLDRTREARIADLRPGEEAMVLARVRRSQKRRTRQGRSLVEIDVFDGAGYLRCTFFNQPWRAAQLPVGTEAVFFGRAETFQGRPRMTNPVVDLVGDRTGRILPIYPQSEKAGLTTWEIGDWIEEALERTGDLADPLPSQLLSRLGVTDRTRAIRQIHAPSSMDEAREARSRLVLDELLRLQLMLVMRKRALEREAKGISHTVDGALVDRFRRSLPFALTGDQERATAEIAADLAGPYPMHRLLQGEVGSGKTVVAVAALLMAVQGGHQGALMVPTEVLAEQHFIVVRDLLAGLTVPDAGDALFSERPVRVELLTNRTGAPGRARLHAALSRGEVDVLVGTHALLTGDVTFHDLGLVVIDEQHRFGVEQRAVLRAKGEAGGSRVPDVLVMTATPIPRTAAMTVFGDLDVTVIRNVPRGRQPVETIWAGSLPAQRSAWEKVRSEVAAGHQAFVVCPLIEESDRIEARSAEEEYDRLRDGELAGLRLGLLHGRVPAKEREGVMAAFRSGEVDVLVATTVVEVGVDVPNATVMVIEDAGRFGIAQLHQLRGRVGRGAGAAWCFLLGDTNTPDGEARLRALERTNDGFELAEVDLAIRGEGSILGTRQKGRSDLKLASLQRDSAVLALARETAFALVDSDPALAGNPLLAEEVRELVDPEEAAFLFKG